MITLEQVKVPQVHKNAVKLGMVSAVFPPHPDLPTSLTVSFKYEMSPLKR